MAALKIRCPLCQQLMVVAPELYGRQVRCPGCQVELPAAPAPGDEPMAADDNPANVFAQAVAPVRPAAPKPRSARASPPSPPPPPPAPTADEGDFAFSSAPVDDPPSPDSSVTPPRRAMTPAGRRGSEWLLAICLPYAVLMTALAVYYNYQYRSANQLHPLELIPDVFGEYKNTTTKGRSQVLRLPPPDAPLPPSLRTVLGVPITVGQIEVTPLRLEQRPITVYRRIAGVAEPESITSKKDAMVLRLRLRNVSADVSFHPTDPYYDRRPRDKADQPFTLVEVGERRFFGGVLDYETERGRVEREWVAGQEAEDKLLRPGESRETVVATHPTEPVIDAVRGHNGGMVWRVHVRRGLTTFRGRDVPVSAVVGVEFTARDVQRPKG